MSLQKDNVLWCPKAVGGLGGGGQVVTWVWENALPENFEIEMHEVPLSRHVGRFFCSSV